MKRRVVVTGMGIISSLGNHYEDVIKAIYHGKSGIEKVPYWEELKFPSTIAGTIKNIADKKAASGLSKKKMAYASDAALYTILAANDALTAAQLEPEDLKNEQTACIVGSGVGGLNAIYSGAERVYSNRISRVNPYTVVHAMSSSCSASISNMFSIEGRSYSISSACATSTHSIGQSFELIQSGAINRSITGGGEELNELICGAFCAMRMALSTHFNDTPETASRPYDAQRDGFVMSGGGGIVVLEDLETAQKRNAPIFAEILGFWANSDGNSMILPEPTGRQTAECMKKAIQNANLKPQDIDYVNTHGTSTIEGDLAEVQALRTVFGSDSNIPNFSSTKSMTGHAIGASGANELIQCIGMLQQGFLAPSINITSLDVAFHGLPIVTETTEKPAKVIMKNSFGFGGTNAVMVIGQYNG